MKLPHLSRRAVLGGMANIGGMASVGGASIGGASIGGASVSGLLANSSPAVARPATSTQITVMATPLPSFLPRDPDRRRFGALEYRSGLHLTCSNADFGGFSGLWRSPDGARIVAISDRGSWLTASVERSATRLTGLSSAVLAPILNARGQALAGTKSYDTEGLAILPDGTAYISIERTHEIMRFNVGKAGPFEKEPVCGPDTIQPFV